MYFSNTGNNLERLDHIYIRKMIKNKIIDYISGLEINQTREEIESVQPLCKELVENLGYPKKNFVVRPQYKLKRSPSGKNKWAIDIALFKSSEHTDENLLAIFECKNKNVKNGIAQLKNYLDLTNAEFGIWDNGKDRKIFKKIFKRKKIEYEEIPSIPKYGEDWKSIGRYKKNDLIIATDLKNKFKIIRNYLAANNEGITRDEKIAQQLIYIIFTKLYDEKYTKKNEYVKFSYSIKESPVKIKERINELWNKVKNESDDIFHQDEKIVLKTKSIVFIVKELQQYSFMNSDRHVISEAFETFIGHSLKGEQGQFFTPRNIIELAVKMVSPNINSKIIDPACGSGGFLIEATRFVWNKIKKKGEEYEWKESTIKSEQKKYAVKYVFGIDKDSFLAKVTKSYMMLIGDGKSNIFNTNSLDVSSWENKNMENKVKYGTFDFVFANPPFGSKIKIASKEILNKYKIIKNKNETPPQILFIEKCIKLLKRKGVLAIVIPDSILGNKNSDFVRKYIQKNVKILAIVSLPITTFQPHTSTKTSLLIMKKIVNRNINKIFIATPSTCGHNRRGEKIDSDDVSDVINMYNEFRKKWMLKS